LLGSASSLIELGCGTGRLAAQLLERELPPGCRYQGVDLSRTMVELARARLAPFGERARVTQSDASLVLPAQSESCDRFLSTYVLDLLSRDDIARALREAQRVLRPGGLVGITSLTFGRDWLGRAVSTLWSAVHRLSPRRVGGCRPLDLEPWFQPPAWKLEHLNALRASGLTSQVLVARRL
jgi:ubiquinone/menaquinone biosynthesis C-methylase UbiE